MIHDPELRYKLLNGNEFEPAYAHDDDSGFDLALPESVIITPGTVNRLPLDIAFDTPPGFEIQIRSRSSTPIKYPGLIIHMGTIDRGYTGNVSLIVRSVAVDTVFIEKGTRLVQAVLAPVAHAYLREVDGDLPIKGRGADGFGSTGA